MPLFIRPFICLWTFSLLVLPGYCESHSFLIASSFWLRGAFSPRLLRFFILFLVFLSLFVEFGFRYYLFWFLFFMLQTFLQCLEYTGFLFLCLLLATGLGILVPQPDTEPESSTVKFSEYACVLRAFSHVWLFATLWTVTHQVAPSMGFSRQYWSGLPCSPLGDLPDPGIETESLMSPALQANSLPIESSGKPSLSILFTKPYKVDGSSVCV